MNELVQQLDFALAVKDFETLENTWLELLEANPVPSAELAGLLRSLVDVEEGARAVELVLALAPDLVSAGRHAEALPLLRAVAPAAEGNEEIRGGLMDCYRREYAELPHLDPCIDSAGLLTSPDLGAAVATLDKLLSYQEGDYFYHPSGWGAGPITGFDVLSASATIDFELKPGHTVPLVSIETIFVPLAPDDFRVLRLTDPDHLRQLAQDNPPELVRMVIAAHDCRLTQRRLRSALAGRIVPEADWSRWWTRARAALKRDPLVEITKGANALMTLRATALTYEDETRGRFDRIKDLNLKLDVIREYADHMAGDADTEAFLVPAAEQIAADIPKAPPGLAFEAALLIDKLCVGAGSHPAPADILAAQDDPLPLLNGLATTPARRLAFSRLKQAADGWPHLCRRILLEGPKELWDAAAGELPTDGEPPTLASTVADVLDHPKPTLELFAWLCRSLISGRLPGHVAVATVFDRLLTEGDELARARAEHVAAMRRRRIDHPFPQAQALNDIRQALRAGQLAYFDQIVEDTSGSEASRLLFRIRQSSILSAQTARLLERKITRRYPRLLAEADKPAATEPELIYATAQGIARRRKERDRIVNDLIPENAKAIGRAAAMGDISDNADWRAAIQERDRLSALAAQMNGELARARPIEPAMVHADHVSIGGRVTIENVDTAERATYDLLGMWDSDAERGIIAYVAPLAQALLRHRVGETVEFEHAGAEAAYRILAIGSALPPRDA